MIKFTNESHSVCCVYMMKQKSGENKLFWRQQHWPTVIAYTWLAFYVFRSAIFSTAWPFFASSARKFCCRISFVFFFFSSLLFWRAFFFNISSTTTKSEKNTSLNVYFSLETLIVYIVQNAYDLKLKRRRRNGIRRTLKCKNRMKKVPSEFDYVKYGSKIKWFDIALDSSFFFAKRTFSHVLILAT